MPKPVLIDPKILELLADSYNLTSLNIQDTIGGLSALNLIVSSDSGPLVLKRYRPKEIEAVNRIEAVTELLAQNDIPVALPLKTPDGLKHFVYSDQYYALFPKIDGKVLHESTLNEKTLFNAGLMLAKIHHISDFKRLSLPETSEILKPKIQIETDSVKLLSFVKENSIDTETDDLIDEIVTAKLNVISHINYSEIIASLHNNRTLIHGDFHNENILFGSNDDVVCVLDFEEAHFGSDIEDIMTFINFACCNSGFDIPNIKKARTFLSGYESVKTITSDELHFGMKLLNYRLSSSFFLENELYLNRDLFFRQLIKRDLSKIHYLDNHLDDFIDKLTSKNDR